MLSRCHARCQFVYALCALAIGAVAHAADRPNVILIITDDQGYGDVSAHGNPLLRTPHLDRLHAQSVRFTNFHVDPTCSPTRSALISGRYSTKTGVWHTIAGRSLMARDEVTLAELFRAAGYRTGMLGKWHLGDAYPFRPHDQGFDETLYHGGGGVGQTPDYWGNDYYDDTYFRDGRPESFTGYCTDVWFREAAAFVQRNHEQPFFLYLATNAPHGPFRVPERYRTPYEAAGAPTDRFLGMVANIDENLGHFVEHLKTLDVWQNTLMIFMTDNGTARGDQVFNAGMRGKKGSEYDGGHRVPCYWHWPKGGIHGGRDVPTLSAHIDVRPTLAELCALPELPGPATDGISLAAELQGEPAVRDRTLFVHSQRILHPKKWRQSAVMTQRWRLVNGVELYDVQQDPSQQTDVAADHGAVVQRLRQAYDQWWTTLSEARQRTLAPIVGYDERTAVDLTAHDWLSERVPWHQDAIQAGPEIEGAWAIQVDRAGMYEIVLSRWPLHAREPFDITEATLTVQDQEYPSSVAAFSAGRAVFRVHLPSGDLRLQGSLVDRQGVRRGAYFARIRPL